MSKVWFITGSSKGFGRIWAEAALERGDKVALTARNADTVAELAERYGENALPLTLDVTDKAAVDAAIAQAHEHFGRLDVVVNNAGYGLFGSVEEVSEQQARDQIETNLFGALWVTQAALPILREQGSGHVIQVSSIGGVHAFPGIGLYHASKWGLEGFTQALAGEVAGLGIKVTIVEPGGFSTDWAGPSAVTADELELPAGARRQRRAFTDALAGRATRRPPARRSWSWWTPTSRRCACSSAAAARDDQGRVRAPAREWERWDHVAVAAQGGVTPHHHLRSRDHRPEVVEGIDLAGKRVIVTGGASGIGTETARALARPARRSRSPPATWTRPSRWPPRSGRLRVASLDLADLARSGVRRRLGRPAGHPGEQRRRHGHPELTLTGRAGDAVRDQPRRPLRARDRPARRAGRGGRADRVVSSRGHLRSPVVFDDI